MFAFVFEAVLFVFAYERPAFAPLFALPPNRTPEDKQPNFITRNNNVFSKLA